MIRNLILLYLVGTEAAQGVQRERATLRECKDNVINVLSFVNSDSDIGTFKKSLDEVPSLAILANDPRAARAA